MVVTGEEVAANDAALATCKWEMLQALRTCQQHSVRAVA